MLYATIPASGSAVTTNEAMHNGTWFPTSTFTSSRCDTSDVNKDNYNTKYYTFSRRSNRRVKYFSSSFYRRRTTSLYLSKVAFAVYHLIDLQTSLNLRDSIESWNKGTNLWLRSIMYERANRNKVLYTYALSALWHGFYPGYYLTFASGAFFTVAARSVSKFCCSISHDYEWNFLWFSHLVTTGPSSYQAIVLGASTKEDLLRYINVHHDKDRNGLHDVQFYTVRIYAKH